VSPIAERLDAVRGRIDAACARAGRERSTVRLVAVTKTVPVPGIVEALAAGQQLFGENRVQEAMDKMQSVPKAATWHLIGHLQRNKAKLAVGAFDLIHGVDDLALAAELNRRAGERKLTQAVLVQANLSDEATKHGAGEEALIPLLTSVAGLPHLELRGLMIIPPPVDDPEASRPWFRRLRAARDEAAARLRLPLAELSMGMTDDFETAIEEGATLVRVGRAIFGERG
jgi:pyridoxal phosphate enzyme (YggS family)